METHSNEEVKNKTKSSQKKKEKNKAAKVKRIAQDNPKVREPNQNDNAINASSNTNKDNAHSDNLQTFTSLENKPLTSLQPSLVISSSSVPRKKKTLEERYQKLTLAEGVFKRSERYVGSIRPTETTLWLLNPYGASVFREIVDEKSSRSRSKPPQPVIGGTSINGNEDTEVITTNNASEDDRPTVIPLIYFTKEHIVYIPALFHIFDEIIINARDHKFRDHLCPEQPLTEIKIWIDWRTGRITIRNNGKCIPVEIHKVHNIYLPELLFTHERSSENYDDSEERLTGGLHGEGSKYTVILSSEFNLQIRDCERQLIYDETWYDNMSRKSGKNPVTPFPVVPVKKQRASKKEQAAQHDSSSKDNKDNEQNPAATTDDNKDDGDKSQHNQHDLSQAQQQQQTEAAPTTSTSKKQLKPEEQDYVQVSFIPDFKKLNLVDLDDVHLRLFYKRVFDIAASLSTLGVSVWLNGQCLTSHLLKNWRDYLYLYCPPPNPNDSVGGFLNGGGPGGAADGDSELETLKRFLKTRQKKAKTDKVKALEASLFGGVAPGIPSTTATTTTNSTPSLPTPTTRTSSSTSSSRTENNDNQETKFEFLDLTEATTTIESNINNNPVAITTQLVPKTIKDQVKMSTLLGSEYPLIYAELGPRWQIGVMLSPNLQYEQTSFVNGINTSGDKPGEHVQLILEQILRYCTKLFWDRATVDTASAQLIQAHLHLFVHCLIDKPAFDSQTKEQMTTKIADFGCDPVILDEKLLKRVVNQLQLKQTVELWKLGKEKSDLKKGDGAKTKQGKLNVKKLEDANDAGGRYSSECTLILTEGDSAKALVLSGMSILGRDKYGVFPLRGKLMNVRDKTAKQITDNYEVWALKKILGLKIGVDYSIDSNFKLLRYGHVMIMTDQDYDGSHIKGLIINVFAVFWPQLLARSGFMQELITPIVKVKSVRQSLSLSFFTIAEYLNWVKANLAPEDADADQQHQQQHVLQQQRKRKLLKPKGWTVKYYKGLGTSTSAEAKEYFRNLRKHVVTFEYTGVESLRAIELAFSSLVQLRKDWLRDYNKDVYVQTTNGRLSYPHFVNGELIHSAAEINDRSLPVDVDQLKPSTRKVLYYCLKHNIVKEVQVEQLGGWVAGATRYHHGGTSLVGAMIGMAENYMGTNNINLLVPSGQFGTRFTGGDAAKPRYIFTHLCPITRAIYPEVDDAILQLQIDDGEWVEPEVYYPVVCMALINGTDSIGYGYSSFVPNYNPRDVVALQLDLLNGVDPKDLRPIHPWYRDFTGTIEPVERASANKSTQRQQRPLQESTHEQLVAPIETQDNDDNVSILSLVRFSATNNNNNKNNQQTVNPTPNKSTTTMTPVKSQNTSNNTTTTSLTTTATTPRSNGTGSSLILPCLPKQYRVRGKIYREGPTTVRITEVPIKQWTFVCKEMLQAMQVESKEHKAEIVSFKEHHTEYTVNFLVELTPAQVLQCEENGWYQTFNLVKQMSLNNMMLFDRFGKLRKFHSAHDILLDYYYARLAAYERRKQYLLAKVDYEISKYSNIVRFIQAVQSRSLDLFAFEDDIALVQHLSQSHYTPLSSSFELAGDGGDDQDDDQDQEDQENVAEDTKERKEQQEVKQSKNAKQTQVQRAQQAKEAQAKHAQRQASKLCKRYDYLLSLQTHSLLRAKSKGTNRYQKLHQDNLALRDRIEQQSIQQMWKQDLETFLVALDQHELQLEKAKRGEEDNDEEEDNDDKKETGNNRKPKKSASGKRKKPNKKSKHEAETIPILDESKLIEYATVVAKKKPILSKAKSTKSTATTSRNAKKQNPNDQETLETVKQVDEILGQENEDDPDEFIGASGDADDDDDQDAQTN